MLFFKVATGRLLFVVPPPYYSLEIVSSPTLHWCCLSFQKWVVLCFVAFSISADFWHLYSSFVALRPIKRQLSVVVCLLFAPAQGKKRTSCNANWCWLSQFFLPGMFQIAFERINSYLFFVVCKIWQKVHCFCMHFSPECFLTPLESLKIQGEPSLVLHWLVINTFNPSRNVSLNPAQIYK